MKTWLHNALVTLRQPHHLACIPHTFSLAPYNIRWFLGALADYAVSLLALLPAIRVIFVDEFENFRRALYQMGRPELQKSHVLDHFVLLSPCQLLAVVLLTRASV